MCAKDRLVVVGEWHGLLAHHTNTPMHWLCCGVAATLLKCCMGCVVFCVCCVAATLHPLPWCLCPCVCAPQTATCCVATAALTVWWWWPHHNAALCCGVVQHLKQQSAVGALVACVCVCAWMLCGVVCWCDHAPQTRHLVVLHNNNNKQANKCGWMQPPKAATNQTTNKQQWQSMEQQAWAHHQCTAGSSTTTTPHTTNNHQVHQQPLHPALQPPPQPMPLPPHKQGQHTEVVTPHSPMVTPG